MKQKIGFMGLGIMGAPMAANILKAGYSVTIFNRSADKTEPLAQMGANVASSPKELSERTDVIIAMVTGPEALANLLWGPDGAAESLRAGKVFVNMSSVSPTYTRDIQQRLEPTGVTFIDAPVSGTKKPAEDGTLIILAAGPHEKVQEIEPILLAMGKKTVYCGPAGQGSMMKMFINLLLGAMIAQFAEVLNFGKMGGLDIDAMLEVVFSGPMNCAMFQMKAPLMKGKEFPTAFPLKHMTKDAKFVIDTAYELGAPVPLGNAILQLYRMGVAQGWGDEDISAIARVLDHMSPA